MVFSSTVFLFLFLPLVIMIYYNPFVKGRKFKNLFLLLASLFFYAWGEPVYVFLMLISILVTWILAFFLRGRYKKVVLTVGIVYHVGVLFIFKYLTFLTSQLGLILNQDFSYIKIALPIGISFFTFQLMSYFLDVYKGEAKPQKNIFNLGLYVSLFPQLIAGPIVRYNEIEEQINTRVESIENVSVGMKRFIYGLSKKLLLADYLSAIADSSFTRIGDQTVVMAWFGILAYSLQIYFDFSGLCLYFFRGGYGKPLKVALNLAVVWILTGIWHGANWTFLVWGILYYLLIVLEKFTGIIDKMGKFSRVYTLVAVMLCWVVFRANNLGEAFLYIENMFGINAGNSYSLSAIKDETGYAVILLASVIGCTPLVKKILDKFAVIEGIWIFLIFALSLIKATSSSYSPFIYFNF